MDENLFIVAMPLEAPVYPGGRSTKTFREGARLIRTGETPDKTMIRFREETGRREYMFDAREFRKRAKNPNLSPNPQ
jgi:hypothetical protein